VHQSQNLIVAIALAAGVNTSAQSIRLGPFLQDATPNSVWVGWESTGGTESTVRFGPAPGRLTGTATGSSISSVGDARIHHAQITGLQPDSVYYYQLQTGNATSEITRFRTPADRSAHRPFRFVAYSDTQGGPIPDMHTQVINQGVIAFVRDHFGPEISDELDFVILPGDLVSNGSNYAQWKTQFFDEEQNLIRHVPIYPVPGNHEEDSHWFFDYFKLPENGSPGYLEHWWYKDHGNVRVVGLDTNTAYRIQTQLDWLDTVLADAAADHDIDFVFAQFHHPRLSGIWTPGETAYSGEIIARLTAFSTATGKPSIHFFGHTHAYERGQSKDHTHLYVNVAAGEGGIDWWDQSDVDYPEFQRVFPDWGFVVVEVERGENPSFRLRRVSRGNSVEPRDNEIMDDLTIRRFNAAPSSPVPLSPPDGTNAVDPLAAELEGSAFSDPDGDFHAESEFQLTTTPADWSNAISHWIRFENWSAPPGATGQSNGYYSVNTVQDPDVSRTTVSNLQPLTTYHWRVRYRDSALAWSEWSPPGSFTTGTLPTGACCLPAGECVEMPEADCDRARGVWLGADAPCACATRIVVLFEENFDSVVLGPNVDEPLPGAEVWTDTPPPGWSVDDAGVPGGGVAEWRGWAFADPAWWAAAAQGQGRERFTRAGGAVAVADPDEWDDAPRDAGSYNARMLTPTIDLSPIAPNSARLLLDSSWRPEEQQRARITAVFDTGASAVVLDWRSDGASANFKPDAVNEWLWVDIPNPPDASAMTLVFELLDAGNNWWWAIDHLLVVGETPGRSRTLLEENFDGLPLVPNRDEWFAGPNVWSDQPPPDWSIQNPSMPGEGDPAQGVEEWEGWAFADRDWWIQTAADQRRSEFTRAWGVVAVADPDEWNDLGNPQAFGPYETILTTPTMNLIGIRPASIVIRFDSSWRPEDLQRVTLVAEFDEGAPRTLLEWDSVPGPAFKPDATNEAVEIPLLPPHGARTVRLRFGMFEAANDWWWAIDNLTVMGECAADLADPFGVLDLRDITAFVAAFLSQEPMSDLDDNGVHDLADIGLFIESFQSGCA
jgi:hypothetical protein